MKLIWKGKMTADNLFVAKDVPEDAKLLSSEKNTWLTYLLIVPILAIAYAGIVIRRPCVEGIAFNKVALYIGVGLSLVFLIVHELIHALCCPKGTTVYVYFTYAGISCVPTCSLKKSRYILIALMPTVLLGIVPFVAWLCFPGLNVNLSSVLFAFSIGSLSMCVGDIYNAILATVKMKRNSVLVTSETSIYYYDTPLSQKIE